MHQETTIVDSGAIVKADIFWNWIIFRETDFSTALTNERDATKQA